LWAAGRVAGWWEDDGAPGPRAGALVDGGFRGARTRRSERPFLIANGQGGFSVSCPACGRGAADAWHRAVRVWEAGGPDRWVCAACATEAALPDLRYAPPVAWARSAVQLVDVGRAEVDISAVLAAWGPARVIGRRGG
ncbi:MAG TPA: hypothetical protein PKA64_16150, partial [Myxococcota bacterium]|nr:hypothetical protein [Myxococcota bacterium]